MKMKEQLEKFIAENIATKLFCDFSLISQTPDHSLFSRLRQSISTNALASIFNSVREQLKQKALVRAWLEKSSPLLIQAS